MHAGRRDGPGIGDDHRAAECVRGAVEDFDDHGEKWIGHNRIDKKPDNEREQHGCHAVPVTDFFNYPTGTEENRHFAAETLQSL